MDLARVFREWILVSLLCSVTQVTSIAQARKAAFDSGFLKRLGNVGGAASGGVVGGYGGGE